MPRAVSCDRRRAGGDARAIRPLSGTGASSPRLRPGERAVGRHADGQYTSPGDPHRRRRRRRRAHAARRDTCPHRVDAGGAWLRVVAAQGGSTVKVVPTRHQLMVTAPLPKVRPYQPITRIIDANVYVRPEKGGLMLGGYEPDPVQYDMRDLPADFQITDLKLDLSVLRRLAESVAAQFPIFRDVEVREYRGGLPTMTADGEHILGPAPGLR